MLDHAQHLHLAGARGHARPAHRPRDAADVAVGLAEDFLALDQGQLEVALRARVAGDEQVVGHAADLGLLGPHVGEQLRVVVDVLEQRRLGADLGAGLADAAHGLEGSLGAQLGGMVEVRHQRQLQAGVDHLAEEGEQVFGVIVVEEAVRPVGDGLGADPHGAQVVPGVLGDQRLDVVAQRRGLHDQRVAAGEEHIGDLVVL